MSLLSRIAALTCLLLVTACRSAGDAPAPDTSGLVEPGFRAVLRVEMKPGTSFDDVRQVQEKYRRSSGLQSTNGGGGEGDFNAMFIFSPDASADEIAEVRQGLLKEEKVETVRLEHRT